MAFYMVRYDGEDYINDSLCQQFYAGGERAFIKMLARGKITGRAVLDQMLFPISEEDRKRIVRSFNPTIQDFDAQYRRIHVIAQKAVTNTAAAEADPGAAVLRLRKSAADSAIPHRFTLFIPFRDLRVSANKYVFLEQMAAVRLCKYWYVALNAVNIAVKKPVIVTVG
jgi:hypothetical protein